MSDDVLCGVGCGQVANRRPYGLLALCHPCKRLATAWCWRKIQGLEPADVLPRYDTDSPGTVYLCILCGYWHWTRANGDAPAEQIERVWALSRHFESVGFHINIARGQARIAHLPT